MNKQHSILFLYSLAPEIKAELAARGSNAEGYIERIRHTNGVEVRDLTAEALANADNYSVIIIVAHHNETLDALILQDGTGLSLNALRNAIPKTFAGLLDISSCGTKALAKAVKERCPSCHVQAAASTAGLELRLFLYANLLPFITAHPDIDYHAAYVRALNEIKQAQQGQQDLKETTKLGGQKNTSVFSPLEVKRKATVPIHVFIHYDSEQKVVKDKAPNTEIHINSESLRGVHVGDELTIRLSFIDNGETHHLRIEGPDEFKVRVEEEIIHHIFKVYVGAEYSSPNFACNINFSKGNEMISSLPVFIDVTDYLTTTSINSQISEESEPTSKSSEHTPNDFAPRKILKELLREPWFKEMRTSEKYNEQWTDDFVNALMESECKGFIITTWEKKRGKKDHENHYGAQHIKCYILAFLKENKVLKPSFDSIARQWQEHEKLNFDYRSLSRYMSKAKIRKGESDLVSLADWVEIYIKNEK